MEEGSESCKEGEGRLNAAVPGPQPYRIAMICLGNICRSPAAMAVMARLAEEAGFSDSVTVTSAGTGSWHVGDPPDRRTLAEARARGIPLEHRGRHFVRSDFHELDLICVMDQDNLRTVRRLAPNEHEREKVVLLRSFDPSAPRDAIVEDPYYGGPSDFAATFDVVEAACRGLLAHLVAQSLL